tara:strand:- start:728 stop:1012 length:285 start_codon:yes stop_codon:yes gene_type:complete
MMFDKNSFLRQETKLVIGTLLTIGVGSVFYHFIENWSWIDSIYFSVITLITVGYGDLHPLTDLGKIFTIFYIITGVSLMLSFLNKRFSYRINKK